MATTALRGTPVETTGDLPTVGDVAPDFVLAGADLTDVPLKHGTRLVLNIFPSIDTGVCAQSVRRFNELAAGLENTEVICASEDLPFALKRFCGSEGIDKVTAASSFRSTFGEDYGVTLAEGAMRGLLARSVVVIDEEGTVLHTELVPDISQEPDYDAAIAALN
ncbi:thiol peroxidase [Intrasporangium calvum]|jgi:thiol peroxidase|uniref:Thiol peroxidase n=1 Tax=Intrasporangium calvum TaxID=53358 RepID=A0ABT5GCQ9_9MICO|nr:thiol peroxidase [Intrasporangium calvum]MDC5696059.1 thiol peroxidase [Intrasporangium calvum]